MDRSTARAARVIAPWVASYDPALKVVQGETVSPGGTDPDNPGWRWCVNSDGLGGWLPEVLLESGRVLSGFDSRELGVVPGDRVEVIDACAGWSFCRNASGDLGWVPDGCLEYQD